MPTSTFTHPLFGSVTFKTKSSTWVRGDSITFLSGFDEDDVTKVTIPQLKDIPGTHGGVMKFHKRGHAQLLSAFADIERFGALKHIKTCAGTFNKRLKKPISGNLSREPSNHSFGIAIDLNEDDGSNGGTVAPVAPFFQAVGFHWGISFNDPMHFEVKTFVDHPETIAQPVQVLRNGVALDLAGVNLDGHPVVDAKRCEQVFGFTRISGSATAVRFQSGGAQRTFKVRRLGDFDFVLLTEASGLAGLTLAWDNATKTAVLA